jgi:hypothetical protein
MFGILILRSCELIFPDDALVTVGLALDAVLERAPCFGEQAHDLEEPAFVCAVAGQAKSSRPGQP